jgi:hypothetical protein
MNPTTLYGSSDIVKFDTVDRAILCGSNSDCFEEGIALQTLTLIEKLDYGGGR